ncbi:MAG: hypothetical protein QM734_06470 [Cyclobacteriaceae bacterium]
MSSLKPQKKYTQKYGMNYQEVIVETNYHDFARHICGTYYAKELSAIH